MNCLGCGKPMVGDGWVDVRHCPTLTYTKAHAAADPNSTPMSCGEKQTPRGYSWCRERKWWKRNGL